MLIQINLNFDFFTKFNTRFAHLMTINQYILTWIHLKLNFSTFSNRQQSFLKTIPILNRNVNLWFNQIKPQSKLTYILLKRKIMHLTMIFSPKKVAKINCKFIIITIGINKYRNDFELRKKVYISLKIKKQAIFW